MPSPGAAPQRPSDLSPEPEAVLESSALAVQDNIVLSGEAGMAFFYSDKKGAFPNSKFRIDEARLFLDVKLMRDIYFFTEILIAERERDDVDLRIGEFYVGFEELPWLSRGDHVPNLRLGRFDIPFGEEHLTRDAPMTAAFIFMAGDVLNERMQAFIPECGALFLAKPFSLDKFRAAMELVPQIG